MKLKKKKNKLENEDGIRQVVDVKERKSHNYRKSKNGAADRKETKRIQWALSDYLIRRPPI